MMFVPSKYQTAIFDQVRNGRGDIIVNAVAGSGKSTTLVEAAKLTQGSGLMMAFNKSIAEELNNRLADTPMRASTIHSLGLRTLYRVLSRKPEVKDAKYYFMVKDWLENNRAMVNDWAIGSPTNKLLKLINMARVTLTDPTNQNAMLQMCTDYNLDYDLKLFGVVVTLIREGNNQATTFGRIDFTDMIYLPWHLNTQPPQFNWVFLDELQDTSAASLDLIMKTRALGGRMLMVGDPDQSILRWAGAGLDSFYRMKERTQAVEMPLSVCYRCPQTHIDLAKTLVPRIEPRPGAPEGILEFKPEEALLDEVMEGDLILCRRNAPLIKNCLELIKRRVPARVRGRDVGKELIELIKEIGKDCPYDDFAQALMRYANIQRKILDAKNAQESAYDNLDDRIESVMVCYAGFGAKDINDLARQIEQIFDDGRASIVLSSIHKAKGTQEKRVWILEYEKLGVRRNRQSDAEAQEELNVKYVGITRSLDTMFLLTSEPRVKLDVL